MPTSKALTTKPATPKVIDLPPAQSPATVEDETPKRRLYDRVADPMATVTAMGQMFTSSGMFGVTKLEQGQILALACLMEDKSPFELVKTYHMIGGKLEMKSSAMLAKFQELGGVWKWTTALDNREIQSAHIISPDGHNELDVRYTMEDAKLEGLATGDRYKKSAPDMLRARLISKTIRAVAPGINSGTYDRAEYDAEAASEAVPLPKEKKLLQRAATKPSASAEAPAEPVQNTKTLDGESDTDNQPGSGEAEDVEEATLEQENAESQAETADAIDTTPDAHILDDIVGKHEQEVNWFAVQRSWVPEGQTYRSIPQAVIEKIVTNSEAFMEQVIEEFNEAN